MCHVRDNVSDHASPEPFVFGRFDQLQWMMFLEEHVLCLNILFFVALSLFSKPIFLTTKPQNSSYRLRIVVII